jgi:hypothetical protein
MDTDPVPVDVIDIKELADHLDGKRVGQVIDHIERPKVECSIQQFVDQLCDVIAQLADDESFERTRHQRTQTSVLWWVLVEKEVLLKVSGRAHPGDELDVVAWEAVAESVVAKERGNLSVRSNRPRAWDCALCQWPAGSQFGIHRVRIRRGAEGHRVELEQPLRHRVISVTPADQRGQHGYALAV